MPSVAVPVSGPGCSGVMIRPGSGGPDQRWDELAIRSAQVDGSAHAAIDLAREVGGIAPQPGAGTVDRWEMLATMAAVDLTAARVAEAHLDALAILAEAGIDAGRDLSALGAGSDSTWGVFAAEGPGARLQAQAPESGKQLWSLAGTKPWCSLAGVLTHALITANTSPGHRGLFAVALRVPSVQVAAGTWVSRGLPAVDSGPIELHDAPGVPVGGNEWYLRRSGFGWGGAGVAACWYGGAVGLARTLWSSLSTREPDQIAQMQLGATDLALQASRQVLWSAACAIDDGRADGDRGAILAARVRGVCAGAAEQVLARVGHALGPAPLTQDEAHARRVADLTVYIRQHHAERDDAALGRGILAGRLPW